ncbi:MAG: NAD-dependent epimerase/dehydratase family protein [Sedimenticola sp.]
MDSKHKCCLVTGASGFVGERLVGLLRQSGCGIRVISRKPANDDLDTVLCDLLEDAVPDAAYSNVDTVYHLAGLAHDFRAAEEIEREYFGLNVEATVRLAESAATHGVRKFVFVSSVKAGGRVSAGHCADESDLGEPDGIYGKTKREAETRLLDIGERTGLDVSIVRPALVYGPGVKGNLATMLSGINGGWFPPLPETGNRRSMIHVDDLVRSLQFIAGHELSRGEIFIATDGMQYSSREIYETLCRILNKNPVSWSVPKGVFDFLGYFSPNARYKFDKLFGDECYSSEKLQSFGFRPRYTLIEMKKSSF